MAKSALTTRFWVIAGAALVGAFITLQLGFWQLNRAAEKQALQADIDARAALPPLDTAALGGSEAAPAWMHRRVNLRGRWLDRHTVFLENRQMDGKPGFYVVTPLQLDGAARVVLVQRGWVQRHFNDRTALPDLPPAVGTVQVDGRIAPPPAKLYAFESREQGKIRQNLDLAGFAQETGLPLAAFSVLQTGPQGDGLLRDWAAIQTGVAKHHGYAFQWFALSGLITVLFIWFQIVRRFIIIR
ncbi:SURF1 family protein [Comamonadaceae bacterium G21597-S1]|nr:SURF1 family protein [Comamonadaceae bacterium G21597-S1]